MAEPLPRHRAREYETIFIVHPDATAETIEQIANRLTDVIDKRSGKLLRAENWGKRRLAYSIRKKRQGYYVYLRYLGYSDLVHEIERNFRMLEPVVKYLTVKVDEDVNPDARPVSEGDISFIPQIEETPDDSVEEASDHGMDEDADEELDDSDTDDSYPAEEDLPFDEPSADEDDFGESAERSPEDETGDKARTEAAPPSLGDALRAAATESAEEETSREEDAADEAPKQPEDEDTESPKQGESEEV